MHKSMVCCLAALAVIACCCLGPAAAQPRNSKTDSRLARYLESHPEADADGDGVLTPREALNHLKGEGGSKADKEKPYAIPPTEPNVAYGEHPRQNFDFWNPGTASPAPVLIFWHGGGFVGGNKQSIMGKTPLQKCLDAGIAVVSGEYRLIQDAPFPAAHMDGVRLIQFLRHNAARFNIDPARIAVSGGSAGGNMSVWIGVHDDLAEPASADPVARESSRVTCIIGYGAQTSNDPDFVTEHIGGDPRKPHPSLFGFYGIDKLEDIQTARVKKLAYEASALNFITPDDPPALLIFGGELPDAPLPADTPEGERIHSARFGKFFKEKYDALGLDCACYWSKGNPAPDTAVMDFLKKQFGL